MSKNRFWKISIFPTTEISGEASEISTGPKFFYNLILWSIWSISCTELVTPTHFAKDLWSAEVYREKSIFGIFSRQASPKAIFHGPKYSKIWLQSKI